MNVIELRNVEVVYTGRAKPSLVVHDFHVEEGESILIVGKSGSGKSTLVNVINGVIPNMISANVKGEINVFGKDPRKTPIFDIAKEVGTVLQDPEMQVFNHKVIDEIAFGPENLMLPPEEIMNRVIETSKITGVHELLDMETIQLSGGELQRTVIASVLAMNPKALILDEPTSNIDPEGTAQIFSLVKKFRQEKRTLIIVEHKLERVLPYVDRVVLVEKGRLVFDVKKEELFDKVHLLREAGVEVPDYYSHLGTRKSLKDYVYIPPPRMKGDSTILHAEVKVWDKKSSKVIVDTSLTLRKGEITALMGKNGAGKSTLLKAIMGILDRNLKSEVKLVVEGKDLSKSSIMERGAYIGYLPQNFDVMFIKRTVEDEVAFAMKNRGIYSRERLDEILKMFSLYEIRREDPLMLSMGQRRRVAMASVIASGSKVLLMDEPTSGQDWYHREMFGKEVQYLRDKGFSFLIVTHDSRFVDKFCDRVVVMEKGRIVADDKPEEIFSKEGLGIHPPTEYLVMKYGSLEFPL